MATSGSIDYSLNARDLCTFALKKARIQGIGETPSAEDMAGTLEDLNMMLKGWQLTGPNLWRQTFGNVTPVAATASYVLSPKPFRVIECRWRSASGTDIPMLGINRQDYVDMPSKASTGTPTQFYVDYQRTEAKLYIWPTPSSVTTETVQYTYQRAFEDLDGLNDDIDIPQEYMETVGYALADRLLETYGKEIKAVSRRAAYLLAVADSADREETVRFEPEFS